MQQISELHSRSLNGTDESANQRTSALLDDLVTRTRQLSNNLKERIQALTKFPAPRPQDARIRNNQVSAVASRLLQERDANDRQKTGVLRTKFVEILQTYQQVERDYRQRYKQRVERQFRIGARFCTVQMMRTYVPGSVKPDATAEEIDEVVNNAHGGGDQIFAQAVRSIPLSSRRAISHMLSIAHDFNSVWRVETSIPRSAR